MPDAALLIRPSREADLGAISRIYGHAVAHGTGTFEIEPPGQAEMGRRRADVLALGLPWLVAERGVRAGFARLPMRPETFVPTRRGLQLQRVHIDAVRAVVRLRPRRRRGLRRRQTQRDRRRFPERSEDFVRPALLGRQLPGFDQQTAVETVRAQALLA